MHIIMGLGNNVFNEMKRVVMELDSGEMVHENSHQTNIKIKLKMHMKSKKIFVQCLKITI